MGLYVGIGKKVSQIAGTMAGLPKMHTDKISTISNSILAAAGHTKSATKIQAAAAKAVKRATSGLSKQQAQAMQMMVATQAGKPTGMKPGSTSTNQQGTRANVQTRIREIQNEIVRNRAQSADKNMRNVTNMIRG